MAASKPPAVVHLVLDRPWSLYAFPAGVVPTDERGLALGLDDIAQIIESGAAGIAAELINASAELAAAKTELEMQRDQVATLLRDKALAGKKGT